MDLRQIAPDYFVAPQLDPADMAAVKAAGITTIICNRPDPEVPPSHQADAMEAAARSAGLGFERLPLTHQTMTPENIDAQRRIIDRSDGPVLAYCASGTRSCVAWALGQTALRTVDDILAAARSGGYDLDGLRPALESAAQQKG